MKNTKILFLAVFCCAVLILACSDKAADPVEEPVTSLFDLTVVDTLGNTCSGVIVRAMNQYADLRRMPPVQPPPALATIRFTMPDAGAVWLSIYNYYGDLVQILRDSLRYDAGVQTVTWDNSGVISGYYQYRLLVVPDQGDTLKVERWIIHEQSQNVPTRIGVTNSEGMLSTNDTLLFPCLLGNQPAVVVADVGGDSIGVITDFYDQRVTLMITDTTIGGGSELYDTTMVVGNNRFDLVFVPVDL